MDSSVEVQAKTNPNNLVVGSCIKYASKENAARKAYKSFLSKNKQKFKIKEFGILDISKDRVPELFVKTSNYIKIYTYYKNKVVFLHQIIYTIDLYSLQYNSKYNYLIIFKSIGTGIGEMNLYKIKDGELKKKYKFEYCVPWGYEEYTYYKINGKKVSKKKYNSYSKKFFDIKYYVYPDFKKCTKTNIKKL